MQSLVQKKLRTQAGDVSDLPETFLPESQSARVKDSNYRLAEALIAEKSPDQQPSLELIRTQCARGNIQEAERLAAEFLGSTNAIEMDHGYEIWLEYSRIAYQQGRWKDAVARAENGLKWECLPNLARITLLQLRCISFYELGDFGRALTDIDAVRTLRLLFPKNQSGFYSEVLRLKIFLKIQGPKAVEEELAKLWRGIQEDHLKPNLDTVLTLVRLQIDYQRSQGEGFAELAAASFHLATAMGDELYAALALVDLCHSESKSLRQSAALSLSVMEGRFSKVDQMRDELFNGIPSSESVRAILAGRPQSDSCERTAGIFSAPDQLIFLDAALSVDLKNLTVTPVVIQQRSRQMLETLRSGAISKAELFETVWRIQYKPEQHDIVVRNALARTRKQARVGILSQGTQVALMNVRVISFAEVKR